MIAPNTDIYLIKTPIEIDESNQLTFNNVEEQADYFMHLPKLFLDNATYQRKDNVIRYPNDDVTFDELLKYNYCCYRNDSYSERIFYAFIKDMKYINDGMTEITIETDVFQTWQFEIQYRSSFVERKHVTNDSFGANTVPEGLETGEYTESSSTKYTGLGENCVILSSAINLYDLSSTYPTWHQGVLSGDSYWMFGEIGDHHPDRFNQLNAVKQTLIYMAGKTDNITCIFMCPENVINYEYTYPSTEGWSTNGWVKPNENMNFVFNTVGVFNDEARELSDFTVTRPTTVGTYTPKNNKLLCFPYCYLMLTNNNGSSAIYHYEDFGYETLTPTQVTFKVKGVVCPGCSIRCYPKSYKNISDNYTIGISCGKFPICSWDTDAYTNWLTQNSVNIGLETATNIVQMGAGVGMAAAGNPLGYVTLIGGAAGIGAELKEMYNKSFIPNQCNGDINSGNIAFSSGNNTFVAHQYIIKPEYARIIDNYFSCYGYKVNSFETPNIHTRSNWNYIKTIDVNLTGEIPQEDLQKLKGIFNKGCTFWHNPNTFLDYSQSNNIL